MLHPRRWPSSLVFISGALFTLWYISYLSNSRQLGTTPQNEQPHRPMPAERYPVKSLFPLPSGTPLDLPQLQHQFGPETEEAKSKRLERLAAVKSSFVHTWEGYKKDAWMRDELAPVTGGYITSFGGWAATLVDSLDTLWIMGFHQDFEFAVHDLSQIDFWTTESSTINVFETTIRYLGGFLGAYDLSDGQYPALLSKATELGEMLYLAFDTPNRMPVTRWDWNAARTGKKQEAGEDSLIAEVGSLTLEFTRLSQLTGDPKYYDAIQRITNEFEKSQSQTLIPGLWPVLVNAKFLTFKDTGFTLGGMADSLYEYLPKQYMLQGGLTDQYKKLYVTSMTAIKKYIFFRPMVPDNADILISGSARAQSDKKVSLDPRGQHLGCFTGGMVGIGAKLFESPDDLKVARKLVDGCIWAYDSMATGIMPEVFYMVPCDDATHCEWDEQKWHHALTVRQRDDDKSAAMPPEDRLKYMIQNRRLPPGYSDIADKRYILRPEAIESVFILYRLTGDPTLQDAAWRMFNAIEKATRTELANAAIEDVTIEGSKKDNRMESFWLAETLKYFFLIFSEPGVVSLDEYVFNTEAHPLRRPV